MCVLRECAACEYLWVCMCVCGEVNMCVVYECVWCVCMCECYACAV